jgi:DNA-binding NarL/FixJ family response regulator
MNKQQIKVCTFSQQPLFQEGILSALSGIEDIQIIGQAKVTDKGLIIEVMQVAAYLSKEINGDQLADMVRRVARGEYPINESLSSRPELAGKILNQFQGLSGKTEVETLISPLTARETEILNYVAQGYSNKQIAAELSISEQTIKNHVASIMLKLNANARTQAVVIAVQQGLISID